MNKCKLVILIIIPLFFISCGEPCVRMNVTTCNLDKGTYKSNEDIVFVCSGNFDESQGTVGTLSLEIAFCKENESEEPKKLNFEIVDSGDLDFDIEFYDDIEHNNETDVPKTYIYFDTIVYKHLPLESFDKKVVFKTSESGTYNALIRISASSSDHPRVNRHYSTIPFTVEAE